MSARPGDEAARPYFWSTEVSTQPRLRHEIAVIYPEEAKERGVKGLVVVRVELTTLGNIARLETVCSAPDFGQAVAEALAAAQFSPALSARGATAVWMLLEFAFLSEADGKINADRAEANLAQLQRQCEEQRRSRSGGAAPLRPFPPSAPASARARAGG